MRRCFSRLTGWGTQPLRLRIIISKKPLINQPHRDNITGIRKGVLTLLFVTNSASAVTIGKKCCLRSEQSSRNQFIYSTFSLLICLSMPLGAIAQSLEAISGPTHGKSGDTLTFVVEARDSDGNPPARGGSALRQIAKRRYFGVGHLQYNNQHRRTRKGNTDT